MYKKYLSILLIILFVLSFFGNVFNQKAQAQELMIDPSISMVAMAAAAFGGSVGLEFAGFGSGLALQDFMSSEINLYLDGRSIIDVFGTELAYTSGALVLGNKFYNEILNFTKNLVNKYNLTDIGSNIGKWFNDTFFRKDAQIPFDTIMDITGLSFGADAAGSTGGTFKYYHNGVSFMGWGGDNLGGVKTPEGWEVSEEGTSIRGVAKYSKYYYGWYARGPWLYLSEYTSETVSNVSSSIGSDISDMEGIDDLKSWSGTISDAPDTNLEDLIPEVFSRWDNQDLIVEGEIIDTVIPPTPIPSIAPDIPLQDVPWEGLNDLIGATGQDITDSIREAAQDITGAVEGVQEGVQDLTDSITEALTAPEIDEKTFDLRELFPFCIPFDIYHLLQKFDGSPAAPHVQLPIVIPSIGFNYTLDLDFSAWDPVASAMRTVELIVYALGLAWATSKVIKW